MPRRRRLSSHSRRSTLGPAVGDHLAAFVVDAALGGDHHFVAATAECAADEVFALAVGAVDVGRVEMIDAEVEALLDRGDAVGIVGVERGDARDRPAAERDGRNGKSRIAERRSWQLFAWNAIVLTTKARRRQKRRTISGKRFCKIACETICRSEILSNTSCFVPSWFNELVPGLRRVQAAIVGADVVARAERAERKRCGESVIRSSISSRIIRTKRGCVPTVAARTMLMPSSSHSCRASVSRS